MTVEDSMMFMTDRSQLELQNMSQVFRHLDLMAKFRGQNMWLDLQFGLSSRTIFFKIQLNASQSICPAHISRNRISRVHSKRAA